MHHPTDTITHTTAFATPVVEHWLEWEIAQWVHREGSIQQPIAQWANALTTELHLATNFRGRIVKLIHNVKWQSFLSPAGKCKVINHTLHPWLVSAASRDHTRMASWFIRFKPYKKCLADYERRCWKTSAQINWWLENNNCGNMDERRKEMFYLTINSTNFIYDYMASDIW